MKLGKTTHIVSSKCLHCGRENDAAASIDDEVAPASGYITICIACGHIMGYDNDLKLRELTDAEMVAAAGDERILAMQKVRARMLCPHGFSTMAFCPVCQMIARVRRAEGMTP